MVAIPVTTAEIWSNVKIVAIGFVMREKMVVIVICMIDGLIVTRFAGIAVRKCIGPDDPPTVVLFKDALIAMARFLVSPEAQGFRSTRV